MASGIGRREFYVNADSMIEGASIIGSTFANVGRLEYSAFKIAKEIIMRVFEEAVVFADSDDGFPPEFQQHVLKVASTIRPTVIVDRNELFVSFDLEESMGGETELKRAYHQGAILADGKTRLDGPYTGQALLTDDEYRRHEFWLAIRYGQSKVQTNKDGKIINHTINNPSEKWEKTKDKYIEIWGNKAPEWLFIQFGQEEHEPTIPSFNIVEAIQEDISASLTRLLEIEFESSVRLANQLESFGFAGGINKAGRAYLTSGSYTGPTGKKYRPGRFIPRGGF